MLNTLQSCKYPAADQAVVAATGATVTGDTVDTLGWDEAVFLLTVYATTGVVSVFKLQGSHDDSTWADISGAAPSALPGASDDNKRYAVFADKPNHGYRYLRFVLTEDGTGTVNGAVTPILARPQISPETASDRGLAAQAIV